MKILFLDTNIFIQCRKLEQLPWSSLISDVDHLLLFIPRAVQEEIDRQKQEGNSRRSKRARKANSLIRQIVLSKDEKLVIKSGKPLVEISFSPPMNNDFLLPDILDLSHPDDRIIAEMLTYQNSYPEEDIAILTHDTNPLLTAKRCGLSYFIIPDDWLLPPEPDAKDKKILQIEQKLRELQNNFPDIKATSMDEAGRKTNHFDVELIEYKSLSENDMNILLDEVKRIYPMKKYLSSNKFDDFNNNIYSNLGSWLGINVKSIPPSQDEIERYQNVIYPSWLKKVEDFLPLLNKNIEESKQIFSFYVEVRNVGNVPAENVIVEFETLDDLFFKTSDDKFVSKKKDVQKFPPPPKPPEWQFINQNDSIFSMINSIQSSNMFTNYDPAALDGILPITPRKHDRNAFYWKEEKPKKWSFYCDEFRHRGKSESFNIKILLNTSEKIKDKSSILCSISAKNLPQPVSFYITLDIKHVLGNSVDQIQKYLTQL